MPKKRKAVEKMVVVPDETSGTQHTKRAAAAAAAATEAAAVTRKLKKKYSRKTQDETRLPNSERGGGDDASGEMQRETKQPSCNNSHDTVYDDSTDNDSDYKDSTDNDDDDDDEDWVPADKKPRRAEIPRTKKRDSCSKANRVVAGENGVVVVVQKMAATRIAVGRVTSDTKCMVSFDAVQRCFFLEYETGVKHWIDADHVSELHFHVGDPSLGASERLSFLALRDKKQEYIAIEPKSDSEFRKFLLHIGKDKRLGVYTKQQIQRERIGYYAQGLLEKQRPPETTRATLQAEIQMLRSQRNHCVGKFDVAHVLKAKKAHEKLPRLESLLSEMPTTTEIRAKIHCLEEQMFCLQQSDRFGSDELVRMSLERKTLVDQLEKEKEASSWNKDGWRIL